MLSPDNGDEDWGKIRPSQFTGLSRTQGDCRLVLAVWRLYLSKGKDSSECSILGQVYFSVFL